MAYWEEAFVQDVEEGSQQATANGNQEDEGQLAEPFSVAQLRNALERQHPVLPPAPQFKFSGVHLARQLRLRDFCSSTAFMEGSLAFSLLGGWDGTWDEAGQW